MNCCYHRVRPAFVLWGLCGVVCAAIIAALFAGCKTPAPVPSPPPLPAPPARPNASLHFDSIKAHNIYGASLDYTLKIENPASMDTEFNIEGWKIIINDKEIKAEGLILAFSENTFSVSPGTAVSPGITEIPIRLELDIPSLIDAGVPLRDDFTVELFVDLLHTNVLGVPVHIQAGETTIFPYIREPVFSITAIAILKAELINTRFRVGLRIDNLNPFPVDLSAFSYELYGNGRPWAEGTERNIIRVPARSSIMGNLFLMMNFIDMSRNLLDQIINLIDVNYRFAGEARVSTGVEYLPLFTTNFNLSGYSQVLDE